MFFVRIESGSRNSPGFGLRSLPSTLNCLQFAFFCFNYLHYSFCILKVLIEKLYTSYGIYKLSVILPVLYTNFWWLNWLFQPYKKPSSSASILVICHHNTPSHNVPFLDVDELSVPKIEPKITHTDDQWLIRDLNIEVFVNHIEVFVNQPWLHTRNWA